MTTLHVATDGDDSKDGSASSPLRTISRAADLARPGDTVLVHGGEYREWVQPRRGGLSATRRITYQAAPGEHVVVKGSERVTGWEQEAGNVWRASVPNSLFGDWNPFAQEVAGDWLVEPQPPRAGHLGEIYLNGLSFYEVGTRDEVTDPPLRTEVLDHWTRTTDRVRNPAQTRLVWYAEVGADTTTVWANFGGADPNAELAEINVRKSVFSPAEHHVDYITVCGFELAQAACPWTPPTADQPGLIGPNWAKGWIIEDNVIHDAKCSAVSLGKGASTGDNYATLRGDKQGHEYQIEAVFSALQIGWDREHIGSHVVRRNTIFDCGQNGIVGHLGCAFSTIEDNHIYNIALKREFYGYEIAGIKLHAAIDVEIRHNRIHDCSLGTWLDWQAQGARVSRNLYYRNNRDLFVEVSHGPYLVEHNVLCLDQSRLNCSARAAPSSTTSSAAPCVECPSTTGPPPTTDRTVLRSRATPSYTAATTAGSATSSSAATLPRHTGTTRRRTPIPQRATAPPPTTAARHPSRTTSTASPTRPKATAVASPACGSRPTCATTFTRRAPAPLLTSPPRGRSPARCRSRLSRRVTRLTCRLSCRRPSAPSA